MGAGPSLGVGQFGGHGGDRPDGDTGAHDEVEPRLVVVHVDGDDVAAPLHLVVAELADHRGHVAPGHRPLRRRARPPADDLSPVDLADAVEHQLHQPAPRAGRRVDDDRTGDRDRGAQGGEGRAVSPSAIRLASAYRTSTASTTSSAEQAQIESWAALRTTSVHASRSSAAGQRSESTKRADSGSAVRSSARSARAAACFTSTRLDVTPISRLARAPERSSPVHDGRPTVERWRGSGEGDDLQPMVDAEPVGFGHDPAQPGLGRLMVVAVHPQQRAGGGK